MPEACPGAQAGDGNTNSLFVNTQRCSDGYTGARCAQCSAQFYKMSSKWSASNNSKMCRICKCTVHAAVAINSSITLLSVLSLFLCSYFCGSSVNQDSTIAATVLVGVCAMSVLAAAVVLLRASRLAQAIQLFSLMQGAAAVGVAGARSSPYFGEQLHSLMSYLNFSQFMRPGVTSRLICPVWLSSHISRIHLSLCVCRPSGQPQITARCAESANALCMQLLRSTAQSLCSLYCRCFFAAISAARL